VRVAVAVAVVAVLAACAPAEPAGLARSETPPTTAPPATSAVPTITTAAPTTTTPPGTPGVHRPAWLGRIELPLRPDGFGVIEPTPQELVDRRVPTEDQLAPPAAGATFASTIDEVPPEVVARSTWQPGCPVALDGLRYVTMSFWGFDDRPHTGEMILNAAVVEDVVGVFEERFEARFPIEEMRVIRADELEAPPTGDGNVTTSFVCRPAVGSNSWSEHAFGYAVDINPFHNPYQRRDLVLPELASAYLDRDHDRPGMVQPGSVAVDAFDDLGWGWGGRWNTLVDYMHFSLHGR
jgi:hypothetical protein